MKPNAAFPDYRILENLQQDDLALPRRERREKRRSGEVGVQEAAGKRGMERVLAAVVEREKENPKGPLQKSHGGVKAKSAFVGQTWIRALGQLKNCGLFLSIGQITPDKPGQRARRGG